MKEETKHFTIEGVNGEFWIRRKQDNSLVNIFKDLQTARNFVNHREIIYDKPSGKSVFGKELIKELNNILARELK